MYISREENIRLNDIESRAGCSEVKSSPGYINIGIKAKCNTQCRFCPGSKESFDPGLTKSIINRLEDQIKQSYMVSFCSSGELLLEDTAAQFLDFLDADIPEVVKLFVTNGTPLLRKVINKKIKEGNYNVRISLHASRAELHKYMTGLDNFEDIIRIIRELCNHKRKYNDQLKIFLFSLLTKDNIGDLTSFMELAADLGVDSVRCGYLRIMQPEHIELSCFWDKERTNEYLKRARDRSSELGLDAKFPVSFGNTDATAVRLCKVPWEMLSCDDKGRIATCCFAGGYSGNIFDDDFDSIWNGNIYKDIRRGLVSRDYHQWCKECPNINVRNLDNIEGHISTKDSMMRKRIVMQLRDIYGIATGDEGFKRSLCEN